MTMTSTPLKLRTIALAAGSGQVGKAIIQSLETIPNDLELTILTRPNSTRPAWLPSHVKTIAVDYDSVSSLSSVLKNQDCVIALFNFPQIPYSFKLLDASIEAGVKLFVPSDFGLDTRDNGEGEKGCAGMMRTLGVYNSKLDFAVYLRQKADEGKIKWTAVYTGRYLDSGLQLPLLGFDFKTHSARIVDGGTRPLTTITMAQVGQATAQILLNPTRWVNNPAKISTLSVTQLELLEELERRTEGGTEWKRQDVRSEECVQKGLEMLKAKQQSGLFEALMGITWDKDCKYSKPITGNDAEILGLKKMTLPEMLDSIGR